jgi:hypothetical protein
MGNGTTADVGHLANPGTDAKICGAMTEQRRPDGYNENESVPQQFVHLVGCRDPNMRRAPWAQPQPASRKP